MSALARIPIRLRLTLAFAAAMALVLAATGLFLYLRLGATLDHAINLSLRNRAGDVAALVDGAGARLRTANAPRLVDPEDTFEDSFAQVLDRQGEILDSTPGLGDRRLLTDDQLARAAQQTIQVDQPPGPDSDESLRLLATPVPSKAGPVVVVVGTTLEERTEALENLARLLLLGGPLALLVASLLGYLLAAAALRPVESMRREAEAVSASEPGRRLPLPAASDEITRLGTTLNRMLGRLEAALVRERRFVSDASHELRTPLATLRAELELALRRRRSRAELEAAVASAAEETERLSQLAEDLLVMARSDDGSLPVRRERLPAAKLLADVRDRYAHRAFQAGRSIEVDAADELELEADRLRLEQAVGNLVDNALRHGAGPVHLAARQRQGRVELHVRDHGPGFPEGFIHHAFERFTRADPARHGQGAGLGLAIVEVIARAHGGSAHVANHPDGPDAWVELPSDNGAATVGERP
jgi:two-component system OmpR family sensor kinase